MPTLSEVAKIDLAGFDRRSSEYKDVTAKSPLRARVTLLRAVAHAHAKAHGFEEANHLGRPGLVGHLSVRKLIRAVFEGEITDGDQMDAFVKGTQSGLTASGLLFCLDRGGVNGDPPATWWVADDASGLPPARTRAARSTRPPTRPKPDVKPKSATRRPNQKVLDRMYRIKAVLADVGTRYDTALTFNEIIDELAPSYPITYSEIQTAVDLLAADKQVKTRLMTVEDKAAIAAAGPSAPLMGRPRVLVMLTSDLVDGKIPTLLGSLEQLKASDAPPAAQVQPRTAEPAPAAVAATEPAQAAHGPTGDSIDVTVDAARSLLDIVQHRIDALNAQVAKLTRVHEGLAAALDSLEDQ